MLTSTDFTFTNLDDTNIASLSNSGFDRILKQTHDELIVTKEMYETLTNDMPVGVWRADKSGIIQYENKTLLTILNRSLLHNHISSIINDHNQKQNFLHQWSNFITDKEINSLNYEFINPAYKNKGNQWIKVKINQLSNNEYMGVISDITVEKSTIPRLLSLKAEMKNISKTL